MNNHEQALKQDTKPGSAAELALIRTALNRHYQRPNIDQSQAFEAGWAECRAALQPTEQPEAAQDERSRFEAWATPRGYSLERTTDSYKSQGTKSAWRGWHAAKRDAAQAPQEPEIECTCPAIDMPFGRCCKAPPEPKTDQWDSARVADYNQGWNDCCALLSLSAQSSEQKG